MVTTQLMQRQIETYREAWLKDYQSSDECFDCEDFIRLGSFIFTELQHLNRLWRERVLRNLQVYSRETDDLIRSLFTGWLDVTSNLLRHNVARLELKVRVEGAEELRRMQSEAIDVLHDWKSPKPSILPALHRHRLTAKQTVELNSIESRAGAGVLELKTTRLEDCTYDEFLVRRKRQTKSSKKQLTG